MAAERDIGISVVTIALNAARDLPLTIESALGQRYDNLEYILIDGASWDETRLVIDRYRGLIDRVIVQEDAGIYHAMNAAAEIVSKNYVLFLNAGDRLYDRNALRRLVAGVEGRPDIFYGNHIYVDGRLELLKRAACFDEIAERLARGAMKGRWHESIPGHQATVTSTALLRTMRYDTQLRVGADHELLFRAHEAGAVLRYVDETVAHYHGGGYSQLMGTRTMLENVSTYRRFSDKPAAVDRLFMPDGSPFATSTGRTGLRLGGFLPQAMDNGGRHGGDRIAAAGARVRTGARPSWGMEINGHNDADGQALMLSADDAPLAWVQLPTGSFRKEVRFNRVLPAHAIVHLRPGVAGADAPGADAAAPSLRGFTFLALDQDRQRGLSPGGSLLFRASSRDELADVLGDGWSGPEDTHLWSIGHRSDLWLRFAAEARTFRLDLSGNPHVEGGDQPVRLLLDGREVGRQTLHGGSRATFHVDLDDMAGSDRICHLAIDVERVSTPPAGSGDGRVLGVCLWQLGVS